MGMASEIEKLGEEIVTSYDRRVKSLKGLSDDLHKMLERFQKERMTDFKMVMDDIKKTMKEIHETQDQRNKEVHQLMQEFKGERKKLSGEIGKMSANWHKVSETMHRRRSGRSVKSK